MSTPGSVLVSGDDPDDKYALAPKVRLPKSDLLMAV
jgi:hypothetical protein